MTGPGGRILPLDAIPLPGGHNVTNVLAAVAVGLLLRHRAGRASGRRSRLPRRRASPGAGRRGRWRALRQRLPGHPARRGHRRAAQLPAAARAHRRRSRQGRRHRRAGDASSRSGPRRPCSSARAARRARGRVRRRRPARTVERADASMDAAVRVGGRDRPRQRAARPVARAPRRPCCSARPRPASTCSPTTRRAGRAFKAAVARSCARDRRGDRSDVTRQRPTPVGRETRAPAADAARAAVAHRPPATGLRDRRPPGPARARAPGRHAAQPGARRPPNRLPGRRPRVATVARSRARARAPRAGLPCILVAIVALAAIGILMIYSSAGVGHALRDDRTARSTPSRPQLIWVAPGRGRDARPDAHRLPLAAPDLGAAVPDRGGAARHRAAARPSGRSCPSRSAARPAG